MVKKIMTFDLIHLHPKYVPTRPNGMEKYAKLCKAQFGWKRQTLLGSPSRLVVLYKLIEGPGLPSSRVATSNFLSQAKTAETAKTRTSHSHIASHSSRMFYIDILYLGDNDVSACFG
jgi:hypothetical protein